MIDAKEAVRLAEAHIRLDQRGIYTYRVTGPASRESRHWVVGFEAVGAGGNVVGGPIVLVVSDDTGAVRSLHDAIDTGWRE